MTVACIFVMLWSKVPTWLMALAMICDTIMLCSWMWAP